MSVDNCLGSGCGVFLAVGLIFVVCAVLCAGLNIFAGLAAVL